MDKKPNKKSKRIKMRLVGIIPARYDSTRFPGKLLADLKGKPVIQHVYERAKKAHMLDYLIVATDSDEIAGVVKNFGGNVSLTDMHETGTERVAEAVDGLNVDIVVNIQGDEPFICPFVIDSLVNVLLLHADEQVASVGGSITDPKDLTDRNIVKVDIDEEGYAVGFSRSARYKQYKHIGIYAYRREFLEKFIKMPKSNNEIRVSLEQLRILDNGYKIRMITTDHPMISIDTPEDLERARELLQ